MNALEISKVHERIREAMIWLHAMAWWPGFSRLWHRGEIYSLVIAFLFATILNLALAATLVWPELAGWLASTFALGFASLLVMLRIRNQFLYSRWSRSGSPKCRVR